LNHLGRFEEALSFVETYTYREAAFDSEIAYCLLYVDYYRELHRTEDEEVVMVRLEEKMHQIEAVHQARSLGRDYPAPSGPACVLAYIALRRAARQKDTVAMLKPFQDSLRSEPFTPEKLLYGILAGKALALLNALDTTTPKSRLREMALSEGPLRMPALRFLWEQDTPQARLLTGIRLRWEQGGLEQEELVRLLANDASTESESILRRYEATLSKANNNVVVARRNHKEQEERRPLDRAYALSSLEEPVSFDLPHWIQRIYVGKQ
jgi:hypothetical protein